MGPNWTGHRSRSTATGRRGRRPPCHDRMPRRYAVAQLPDTLASARDRAILLLGFAGAFRRSELASLAVSDLEFWPTLRTQEGPLVRLRQSKTDPDGAGQVVTVLCGSNHCPVGAVRVWLEASRISEGPLFRPVTRGGGLRSTALAAQSIGEIVKALCRAGRVRSGGLRRPFAALWLADLCRRARRLALAAPGRLPASLPTGAAGLCALTRGVPRSCGRRTSLISRRPIRVKPF
jgi:integrase